MVEIGYGKTHCVIRRDIKGTCMCLRGVTHQLNVFEKNEVNENFGKFSA